MGGRRHDDHAQISKGATGSHDLLQEGSARNDEEGRSHHVRHRGKDQLRRVPGVAGRTPQPHHRSPRGGAEAGEHARIRSVPKAGPTELRPPVRRAATDGVRHRERRHGQSPRARERQGLEGHRRRARRTRSGAGVHRQQQEYGAGGHVGAESGGDTHGHAGADVSRVRRGRFLEGCGILRQGGEYCAEVEGNGEGEEDEGISGNVRGGAERGSGAGAAEEGCERIRVVVSNRGIRRGRYGV
mmetsp:Transcript_20986/g.50586  ORF Transcript_20986/g.50586 Transcript_20986/m.50586 type:complete len:242 (+) Transcript_20986:984-1709(+)